MTFFTVNVFPLKPTRFSSKKDNSVLPILLRLLMTNNSTNSELVVTRRIVAPYEERYLPKRLSVYKVTASSCMNGPLLQPIEAYLRACLHELGCP